MAAFRYAKRLNDSPHSEAIVIGWDRTGAYGDSDLKYDFVYPLRFPENLKDAPGILIYFQQMNHIWRCFRALIKPMWKLRHRYDIIHNFNSGFAFNRVSIFIGKILGKKVITETSLIGDDDPISLGRFPTWKDYFKPKYLRYKFYKMADVFVSKSGFMSEIFQRSELPENKVVQVPYSVDVMKFHPLESEEKRLIRRKLGLWEEGKIILFVGGINVRKGVHLLLDAFVTFEKKYPDTKLLIVGPTYKYDQKYIADIKEKINKFMLQDRVKLTEDNVKNVEEYMQSSDIFVLPSRQEGFPISIVEAMSSGLAVAASDIPEISKDQITDGVNGYLFPIGNKDALAKTLISLFENKEYVSRFGDKAREKAISNWSTEIVDEAYRKIYHSLLEKPSRHDKKIRILFTIPNFNTAGSGRALINVISRLDRNLFEPCICCRHERGNLFSSAKELNVPIYISNFTAPTKPRIIGLKNVLKLSRFFKKINPDIIHSYNYSDDYSEALAARLSGIKWVYTKKNMGWGSNAWRIRSKLANAIIPQNHEMVNTFFAGMNKCRLIPIGIDSSEFSVAGKDKCLIEKYGLSDSSPVVLTIANIIPIKGIEHLIRGFALILEDFEKAKLIIVGEDRTVYADRVKKSVSEMGISDKVIFTGKQNDIKKFFTVADIFMLSSVKTGEGGPISVLEAMSSGVLSYGSDVPGIRDMFRKSKDQLFESENPGSIANKIINAMYLTEEEKRERIERQRQFITENYSIEKEAKQLKELYLNLVRNHAVNKN